jgi:hypothetical protein
MTILEEQKARLAYIKDVLAPRTNAKFNAVACDKKTGMHRAAVQAFGAQACSDLTSFKHSCNNLTHKEVKVNFALSANLLFELRLAQMLGHAELMMVAKDPAAHGLTTRDQYYNRLTTLAMRQQFVDKLASQALGSFKERVNTRISAGDIKSATVLWGAATRKVSTVQNYKPTSFNIEQKSFESICSLGLAYAKLSESDLRAADLLVGFLGVQYITGPHSRSARKVAFTSATQFIHEANFNYLMSHQWREMAEAAKAPAAPAQRIRHLN